MRFRTSGLRQGCAGRHVRGGRRLGLRRRKERGPSPRGWIRQPGWLILWVVFGLTVGLRADEVDDYLRQRIQELHIPGLSLAVVQRGEIIKSGGYGFADLQALAPATAQTVYEIGSLTKQFTAAAVMALVEEGALALDDPMTKFFPEAPSWWSRITLRHVLTHTSGLRNHVAVPGYLDLFQKSITGKTSPSRQELLQAFYQLPSEFEPGATWAYDNTGYYLLGFVIEQASGQEFWEFLTRRLFEPLGMRATRNTDPRPIVSGRASGYEWVADAYENRPDLEPFVAFSAGCILSTVEDLAKWDAALRRGTVLSQSSLDAMFTAARGPDGAVLAFDYGFGWFVDAYFGHRFVQHSGGTPGFSSVMYRFLEDDLTVIMLTNHADRFLDQLAIDVAGAYVPGLKRPAEAADPDPALSAALRGVMERLIRGESPGHALTRPLALHLQSATGKGLWRWVAYHGELNGFAFSSVESVPGGQRLRYRVRLGGNPYWFSFRVQDDGAIAQILWW